LKENQNVIDGYEQKGKLTGTCLGSLGHSNMPSYSTIYIIYIPCYYMVLIEKVSLTGAGFSI
jgi:hypothetical protein